MNIHKKVLWGLSPHRSTIQNLVNKVSTSDMLTDRKAKHCRLLTQAISALSLNIHLISLMSASHMKQEYPKTTRIKAKLLKVLQPHETTAVHSLHLHYPVICIASIISQFMIVNVVPH